MIVLPLHIPRFPIPNFYDWMVEKNAWRGDVDEAGLRRGGAIWWVTMKLKFTICMTRMRPYPSSWRLQEKLLQKLPPIRHGKRDALLRPLYATPGLTPPNRGPPAWWGS
eukprot:5260655-Prymnesium_polylepis.1